MKTSATKKLFSKVHDCLGSRRLVDMVSDWVARGRWAESEETVLYAGKGSAPVLRATVYSLVAAPLLGNCGIVCDVVRASGSVVDSGALVMSTVEGTFVGRHRGKHGLGDLLGAAASGLGMATGRGHKVGLPVCAHVRSGGRQGC